MLVKVLVVLISTSAILTFAATTTERSQSRGEHRIYTLGGRRARLGEFPYLVMLKILILDTEETSLCSGSIPSPTTVLTAAHCSPAEPSVIKAYAGLVSGKEHLRKNINVQVRSVKSLKKPEYYLLHDIMICYVNQKWVWTQFVGPVTLHLTSERLEMPHTLSCQVMGFGMSEPYCEGGVAHVMTQKIGGSWMCKSLWPDMPYQLCSDDVKNKTCCHGDSGGPAVCGDQQWGVIHAGRGLRLHKPEPEEPLQARLDCLPPLACNLYMNVAFFRKWIRNNIKDLSSAHSIHQCSVKISLYEMLLHPPPWLLLLVTAELLYLH